MSKDAEECQPVAEVKAPIKTPETAISTPRELAEAIDEKPEPIKEEIDVKPQKDPNKQYIDDEGCPVINLDEPQWDGSTFSGRMKNYMAPRRLRYFFASSQTLKDAKELIRKYLCGEPLEDVTVNELWEAKHKFDSTFHPDTGEEISLPTRKSAVVPVDGLITGLMMTFYRSIPGIIIGQWAKQTYTSGFDFANRTCDKQEIKIPQYKAAYAMGTGSAIMTAIGLGSLIKKCHPPVLGRLVPFAGVAAATLIYNPFLNARVLNDGWQIYDQENNLLGCSPTAAAWALPAETIGKVAMVMPPMVIPPFIMHHLEYKKKLFCRYPWAQAPIQIGLCCLCIMFLTPMVRALFPDRSPMPFTQLEDEFQEDIKEACTPPDTVYMKNRIN
ncbi:hypothetical protein L9F63_008820 [Diploptera punctata]|uniref:Sideroflexin n=1 Tax=Diploptera punctata TaxID=6984 RepID=A0AAD7Z4H5_DIPPU|nr:hypothetical protein L9F63_008820 [Diploptera punctata]